MSGTAHGRSSSIIAEAAGRENRAMRSAAAERYRQILDKRSADERRTLAHIKRFIERYVADPRFRDKLRDDADRPERVAQAYGIAVDPRQALPLFRTDHMQFRFSDE